jgi:hypothetical protein
MVDLDNGTEKPGIFSLQAREIFFLPYLQIGRNIGN